MKKLFIMLFSIQMLFATLVPEIKKGNSIEGSIERGGKEYYRVEIKTWEDVRITLTDLSADISLYVKTDDDPREEVLPRIRENDCASTNLNTEDEECQYQIVIPEKSSSVDNSTSVYIMVYGLEAGDYTLTVTEEKHSTECITIDALKKAIVDGDDVTNVNTSCIKDMSYLFFYNTSFNQDISSWDVSNVTNMDSMFYVAQSFNQDISSWNVSNVTNMNTMFASAINFVNHDLSGWNVSKVTTIRNFASNVGAGNKAPKFKKDVGRGCITIDALKKAIKNNEDVRYVDTFCIRDMSYLFADNHSFNQDISLWKLPSVENMEGMFKNATSFNQDISSWDVSNVDNMESMFENATSFNQDISSWDVYHVANMNSMFKNAISFVNHDLSGWSVKNVWARVDFANGVGDGNKAPKFKNITDCLTHWQLSSAIKLGQDVRHANTSCIKDMSSLFKNNKSFNQDISSWDVSNVENMESMFENATSFNQDISSWNVSNLENMNNMFKNAVNFVNHDLSGWNVANVVTKKDFADGVGDGNRAPKFKNIQQCLTRSELSRAINSGEDVSHVNTYCIRDMSYLFANNSSFNQDISSWDVSNVTDMKSMFKNATSFNQDINSWNVSSVTHMESMFKNATSFNQDISSWDVHSVKDMSYMFNNTKSFSNHDLSGWNVENVWARVDFANGVGDGNRAPRWVKEGVTLKEYEKELYGRDDSLLDY